MKFKIFRCISAFKKILWAISLQRTMFRGSSKVGIAPAETELLTNESSTDTIITSAGVEPTHQNYESYHDSSLFTDEPLSNARETPNEEEHQTIGIPSVEGIPSAVVGIGAKTAASNIQRVARGKAARVKVEKMRLSQTTGLESAELETEINGEGAGVGGTTCVEVNEPMDADSADDGQGELFPLELNEKNAAAANIQRVARGKAARNKVEQRRQSIMTENQNKGSEAQHETGQDAITSSADEINNMIEQSEQDDEDDTSEGIDDTTFTSGPDMAASNIQRVVRGKSARSKVAKMRGPEDDASADAEEAAGDSTAEEADRTCSNEKPMLMPLSDCEAVGA